MTCWACGSGPIDDDLVEDISAAMQDRHDRDCFGSTSHWQNCPSTHCERMTEILGRTYTVN